MQKYQDEVKDPAGNGISGASVTVKTYPADVLATLYDDDGVTVIANPVTTDLVGRYFFRAVNGNYSLTFSATNIVSYTKTDIQLFDPADGAASSDIGYMPAGTGAVATTVQTKLREIVSVKDFGAVGDGVTNDRLKIKAAVDRLVAVGGGDLIFPDGADYLISGFEGVYALPELASNLQYSTTNYEVQLYFSALSNINFVFNGSRLVSNKTDGGYTLIFDGCTDITFDNIAMTGATVMSGSTASTTGTNAIGLLSLTQNSRNITFNAPKLDAHYGFIDVFGNPASSFRVINVSIEGAASFRNGYYGLACRGNGIDVKGTVNTYRLNRPFFIYDTSDVGVNMVGDEMNGGFQSIVKAYTVNTTDIDIDFTVKNRANTQNCLAIQSQHNPALQATPASVRNIDIKYIDIDCVAGGESIRFDYYQDTTLTATSNQLLFSDVRIKGKSSGDLVSGVTLTSIANYCVLDAKDFVADNGFQIYTAGSGFIQSYTASWTPTDNSGAALSLTTAACNYTVNHLIFGTFAITYPVTANTNSASIAGLPIKSKSIGTSSQGVTIGYTDCGLAIYGLIASNAQSISWYKNTGVAIQNNELSGKIVRGSFSYLA